MFVRIGGCCCFYVRYDPRGDLLGRQMLHWYPYRCNVISFMFVSLLSSSMRIKCIKFYCLYLWIRNGLISIALLICYTFLTFHAIYIQFNSHTVYEDWHDIYSRTIQTWFCTLRIMVINFKFGLVFLWFINTAVWHDI